MLQVSGTSEQRQTLQDGDMDCFKARLIAVLLEYGDKGLDLSNVKKKWRQVWPDAPFPDADDTTAKRTILSDFIRQHAGDVVEIIVSKDRSVRVVPKHCTRAHVVAAHVERAQRKET
jgi:hypothetical protein